MSSFFGNGLSPFIQSLYVGFGIVHAALTQPYKASILIEISGSQN